MSSPSASPVADPGAAGAVGRDETAGHGLTGRDLTERDLTTALPADWALIGRCRTGDGAIGDEGGCFVLTHAAIGVALVDLAPCTTPDAELRLRRLLNLVNFAAVHRGYLPIVHCRVGSEDLGGLLRRLDAAFAYEPRLGIRQRTTWVAALRRVLRDSGTWEAIGQPLPISWGETEDGTRRQPRGALLSRNTLAAMALLATFGAGLSSGLVWTPPLGGAGSRIEAGGVPGTAGTTPLATAAPATSPLTAAPSPANPLAATPATVLPGAARPGAARDETRETARDGTRDEARETDDSSRPGYRALPSAAPVAPSRFELPAPLSPVVPPPLLSASVGGMAVSQVADVGAGLTGAVSQPVPQVGPQPVTAEAVAGPTPARRAREPMPIDRRCSEAVFRYQQGASLSEGEMGYVRRGCASWR